MQLNVKILKTFSSVAWKLLLLHNETSSFLVICAFPENLSITRVQLCQFRLVSCLVFSEVWNDQTPELANSHAFTRKVKLLKKISWLGWQQSKWQIIFSFHLCTHVQTNLRPELRATWRETLHAWRLICTYPNYKN